MNLYIVIWTYVITFVVAIVSIFCIKQSLKKLVINPQKAIESKKDFIIYNQKKFNLVARIVMIGFVVVSTWLLIIPAILDLPIVLQNKYLTIQCVATQDEYEQRGVMKIRDVHFREIGTGKEIGLKVAIDNYSKDEVFEVIYLPHLRIGTVKQKLQN